MRNRTRVLVGLALALAIGGCSLILDTKSEQCASDLDCARFGMAACDRTRGICVSTSGGAGSGGRGGTAGSAAGSGGSGGSTGGSSGSVDASVMDPPRAECQEPQGCVVCAEGTGPVALPNRCSEGACVGFDNRGRLTKLLPDGGLRPLPPLVPSEAGDAR